VVRDPSVEAGCGRILNHHPHLFWLSQRERLGYVTPHAIARPARQQCEVAHEDQDKAGVVDDGNHTEHRGGD
jgi:hypothetical protein